MTRGLDADLVGELQGADPEPIVLLEIATGNTTTPTVYLTSNEKDHKWPTATGTTYTARPFELGDIVTEGGEFPGLDVRLPDTDSYWDTWLLTTDFRHQRVTRRLVDRDRLADSTECDTDVFRISNHRMDGYQFVLTVEPLQSILQRLTVPLRTMTREDFPGMPTEGMVN